MSSDFGDSATLPTVPQSAGGSRRGGGGQAQAALAPLPAAAGKCASVAGPFRAGRYREGRAEKKQCARENISRPD